MGYREGDVWPGISRVGADDKNREGAASIAICTSVSGASATIGRTRPPNFKR